MRTTLWILVCLTLVVLTPSLGRTEGEDAGEAYAPVFPEPLPFDPAAWTTNDPAPTIAESDAPKGGRLVLPMFDWPPTLRTEGPSSRLAFLSDLHGMVYETLLEYDTVNWRFAPGLASHWQVSDDNKTYRFRIDERARWADGREVTADDVLATTEHLGRSDRMDPLAYQFWTDLVESVKVLDKYTVEIALHEPRWRGAFVVGAGMRIYPAAYIRMDGPTYLEAWNWKLPPGTGPYEIRAEDLRMDASITLRRRDDWWARDLPQGRGTCNFDRIEFRLVAGPEAAYEGFLRGELDVYRVMRASRWVNELEREEAIRLGWIQRRKIHDRSPQGFGGYCFNQREAPFDRREVREAFACLFDRETLFDDLFFNQYEYMDSYFPGQPWARADAKRDLYDPARARELLAAAGWSKRDEAGRLVNEAGEAFPVLTLPYASKPFQRIHEALAADLWNEAGITLRLELLDFTSLMRRVWQQDFQVVYWSWTASLFPDFREFFHSSWADANQSNNITGFRDEKVDEILDAYGHEFDPEKRKGLLQQLDERLFDAHPYALGWYAPYVRLLYWDRFGHPPEYVSATGGGWGDLMRYWWYAPEKAEHLIAVRRLAQPNHPGRPNHQDDDVEQTWWRDHDRPMPDAP